MADSVAYEANPIEALMVCDESASPFVKPNSSDAPNFSTASTIVERIVTSSAATSLVHTEWMLDTLFTSFTTSTHSTKATSLSTL
jgi:hypothetical protein